MDSRAVSRRAGAMPPPSQSWNFFHFFAKNCHLKLHGIGNCQKVGAPPNPQKYWLRLCGWNSYITQIYALHFIMELKCKNHPSPPSPSRDSRYPLCCAGIKLYMSGFISLEGNCVIMRLIILKGKTSNISCAFLTYKRI